MKNYEFWFTKKCPGKGLIYEFINKFIKNHEFIYEFMGKTYDLGCTKKCPVKQFLNMNSDMNSYNHIHTCEFIYELMYENISYEFIYELIYEFMYLNSKNMNSCMNSYTNNHNMAIRLFQIWRSGCSRSERRRRVSQAGCGEQRRAAAPSE